jgi:dynein heavy chain
MAHPGHWSDEDNSFHRTSPASSASHSSELWKDARSPERRVGGDRQGFQVRPEYPENEHLARSGQLVGQILRGRLCSGAEQSRAVQLARHPHLSPAYKTLKAKKDERLQSFPKSCNDIPLQMKQDRPPLPAIVRGHRDSRSAKVLEGRIVSVVDELHRLRVKLGWNTAPRQDGLEVDAISLGHRKSGTKEAEKLMRKFVPGSGAEDDGEFVNCLLRQDPCSQEFVYNPYELRIVSQSEAKKAGVYYTVSASAVSQIVQGGELSMTPSLRWLWEREVFMKLRKLRVFQQFRLWKSFQIWHFIVCRQKSWLAKVILTKELFTTDKIMQLAILNIQFLLDEHCTSYSIAGFHSKPKDCDTEGLELFSCRCGVTYTLEEFVAAQQCQGQQAKHQLAELRSKLICIVQNACQALIERENVSDALHVSTQEQRKEYHVVISDDTFTGKKIPLKLKAPPKKPSYSERIRWCNILERILKFIKLVECYILEFLHRLIYKALESLLYRVIHGATESYGLVDYGKLGLSQQEVPPTIIQELQNDQLTQFTHYFDELLGQKPKLGLPLLLVCVKLEMLEGSAECLSDVLSGSTQTVYISLKPSPKDLMLGVKDVISNFLLTAASFQSLLSAPELSMFVELPYVKKLSSSQEQKMAFNTELGPNLLPVLTEDSKYQQIIQTVYKCLEFGLNNVSAYCSTFDEYTSIVDACQKFDLKKSVWEDWGPGDFESVLLKHNTELQQINEMKTSQCIGCLLLDSKGFQASCLPYPKSVIGKIHEVLPPVAAKRNDALLVKIKISYEKLQVKPSNVAEFVQHLALLSQLASEQPTTDKEFTSVCKMYAVAYDYKVNVLPEDVALHQTLKHAYSMFQAALNCAEVARADQIIKFSTSLNHHVQKLRHSVVELKNDVLDPILLNVGTEFKIAEKKLEGLERRLKTVFDHTHSYTTYHETFGMTPSTIQTAKKIQTLDSESEEKLRSINDELFSLKKDLDVRSLLWKSVQEWSGFSASWLIAPFETLHVQELQHLVQRMTQTLYVLERRLPGNSLVSTLSFEVNEFKKKVPVVVALCNPALRERHWQIIQQITGDKFLQSKGITLEKLIAMQVFKYSDKLLEISQQASNEATLEHMLQKIVDSWISTDFTLLPYKEMKDVYIIGLTDDLQTMLEETLVTMTTIRNSPYVSPIKHAVEDWNQRLTLFAHVLEQWLTCQRKWIYLESIFTASDIRKQLSNEYQLFVQVDRSWKEIMRMTSVRPNAVRAACVPGILETLQSNNVHLDRVQKCLEDYLEMKRMAFPRFYFLSNEELFDILANARNPNAIQSHLVKCFSNIRKLELSTVHRTCPSIRSMISAEGEVVPLLKHVSARGSVETWLSSVESAMFSTIKRRLKVALFDYHEPKARQEWALMYPGQVALTASQIVWTEEVVGCLTSSNPLDSLNSLYQLCVSHLNKLAHLVHTRLEFCQKEAIVALVTTDVHARDVVSLLIMGGVHDVEDFDWVRQLRYYWELDSSCCHICQALAVLEYGYEYLGCTHRLVMTPLTDRCYLTLTGALQLHLGGSPAGPAGTGKTETVKDLAKAVGKHCLVFNCSEGLTYQMLGKFFSGMSQSGSWCCLDEFNRIDVEVLSVVAQQLQTIKSAKDCHAKVFIFEGKEIPLNESCGSFVTMNLRYAGRVELPDNVKSLFRPVSMTVPDSDMIAEVILYSQGFTSAAALSKKIVKLYQLADKQLSHQHHYDFGMRAIKLVLVMAGAYKRASINKPSASEVSEEEQETLLLIKALQNANVSKLLVEDALLMDQLISDLFPDIQQQPIEAFNVLKLSVNLVLSHLSLEESQCLIQKCDQLYGTLLVRHGVMLVGLTGGGKTTAQHVLAQALNVVLNEGSVGPTGTSNLRPVSVSSVSTSSSRCEKTLPVKLQKMKTSVRVVTLNPKCVTLSELYGHLDPNTLEWTDGLLSFIMRLFAKCTSATVTGTTSTLHVLNTQLTCGGSTRQMLEASYNPEKDPGSDISQAWNELLECSSLAPASCYLPSISGLIQTGQLSREDVAMFVNANQQIAPFGWHWLVLDGPVDTMWVENLNTALDDNKVLCLANGERIQLGPGLRLVFEVDNLANASPSTVSRCGMVYMDPADLGWRPYIVNWLKSLPSELPDSGCQHLLSLFDHSVNSGLDFLHMHHTDQFLPTCDFGVVMTLCNLLASLLSHIASHGGFGSTQTELPDSSITQSPLGLYQHLTNTNMNQLLSESVIHRQSYLHRHPQKLLDLLGKLFVFAFTWAFGGTLTDCGYGEEGDGLADFINYKSTVSSLSFISRGSWCGGPRAAFDVFVHELFSCDPPIGVKFPPSPHTMFSYYVDVDTGNFVRWQELLPSPSSLVEQSLLAKDCGSQVHWLKQTSLFHYSPSCETNRVMPFVPTVDMVRFSFLINLLVLQNQHVLITGGTGVGKSSIVHHALNLLQENSTSIVSSVMGGLLGAAGLQPIDLVHDKHWDQLKVQSKSIHMSAFITTSKFLNQLESCMMKLGRNMLGSPESHQLIMFLDDLNIVHSDSFDVQPPLEIVRQIMDTGMLCNPKTLQWKTVSNVNFIGTCGPAQKISPRLLRHFSMLNVCHPGSISLRQMLEAVLHSFFEQNHFASEVKSRVTAIVASLVYVYQYLATSLKPTPTKPFCCFNMTDLVKVICSLQQCSVEALNSADDFETLFCYEAERVFADRLSNSADKCLFYNCLADATRIHLQKRKSVEELQALPLFADFIDPGVSVMERKYQLVKNKTRITRVLEESQGRLNLLKGQTKTVIFFDEAVRHIVRAARVLRQPGGHLMMIGHGGVGRHTAAHLAFYVCRYEYLTLTQSRTYSHADFREDMKQLYRQAGIKDKPTAVLLTDAHLAQEAILEDVSELLVTGDIHDLFEAEELEVILSTVHSKGVADGIKESRQALYDYFIASARKNIHVFLSLSPSHPKFLQRFRLLPALLRCCTLDWFDEWSSTALLAVSETTLGSSGICDQSLLRAASTACVQIHCKVQETSQLFKEEFNRKYHATPADFLGLLKVFVAVLETKQDDLSNQRSQLQTGLYQLSEARVLIGSMQQELEILKPEIEVKSEATEVLLKQLAEEQKRVDLIRFMIKQEEMRMAEETKAVESTAEEAQRDLENALPALVLAISKLQALDKADIAEIRVYTNPPDMVMTVMAAVCVILQEKPDWPTAKRLLGDSGFLFKLVTLDKENVSDKVLLVLKQYTEREDFDPDKIGRVSVACKSICSWVLALKQYAEMYRVVEPKRVKCIASLGKLQVAMEQLQEKQSHLHKVELELLNLQQQYSDSATEQGMLQQKHKQTEQRIERAKLLIKALQEEEKRWSAGLLETEEKRHTIVGDSLMSAACLTYFGPYTTPYRQMMIKSWLATSHQLDLHTTPLYTFTGAMASDCQIQNWYLQGLPGDMNSVENAILITHHHKWPLIIDPEAQARKWLQVLESSAGLVVINATEPNYMRVLEGAVQTGTPVLLEQITEIVDPILEPLLHRNIIIRKGECFLFVGDKEIQYSPQFRLYLCSSLANPQFAPELCSLVTIVNFTVTFEGLEEQLLSAIVDVEKPELEREQSKLTTSLAQDRNQLMDLEKRILELLQSVEGHILDKQELLDSLQDSKQMATELVSRLKKREKTQAELNVARDQYLPVASRGAILYFTVRDLSQINVMYQFSIDWFKQLFLQCIIQQQKCQSIDSISIQYRSHLIHALTFATYCQTIQGLFREHHLLFAFLMCTNIIRHATSKQLNVSSSLISADEWSLFVRGGSVKELTSRQLGNLNSHQDSVTFCNIRDLPSPSVSTKPTSQRIVETTGSKSNLSWLSDAKWVACQRLGSALFAFNGLCNHILNNQQLWTAFHESTQPYHFLASDQMKSCQGWPLHPLSSFHRLLLTKALRQDALYDSVREFVKDELGEVFVSTPVTNVMDLARQTKPHQPIIFILSPGCDPASLLISLCEKEFGQSKNLHMVSLGRGQGSIATDVIHRVATKGRGWVFLQNCHLASSWMPSLKKTVERLADSVINPDFRLWLSSLPTETFPTLVLQVGNKITVEQPQGIRSNIEQSIMLLQSGVVRLITEQTESSFAHLLFSICIFHAVISERKKYGSLGWNVPYVFSMADLEVAIQVLSELVQASSESTPWKALHQVTGEIVYGGRVTDDWDRRTQHCLLNCFYSKDVLNASCYMNCQEYPTIGSANTLAGLEVHTRTRLPLVDRPEVCGLHPLADVFCRERLSRDLFDIILSIEPKAASARARSGLEDAVEDIAKEAIESLPSDISKERPYTSGLNNELEEIRMADHPPKSKSASDKPLPRTKTPLQTVLHQEVNNFNNLLKIVRQSLTTLLSALKGEAFMSDDLVSVCSSLAVSKVPLLWQEHSYVSQRHLGGWLSDLSKRVSFFSYWMLLDQTDSGETRLDDSKKESSPSALNVLKAAAMLTASSPSKNLKHGNSPGSYWLPAFFYPQGFLTAVLQVHARKYRLPLSNLKFRHLVNSHQIEAEGDSIEKVSIPPEDGVLIHGLYLQGAAWDKDRTALCEQCHSQQELFPQIHFLPEVIQPPVRTFG